MIWRMKQVDTWEVVYHGITTSLIDVVGDWESPAHIDDFCEAVIYDLENGTD